MINIALLMDTFFHFYYIKLVY